MVRARAAVVPPYCWGKRKRARTGRGSHDTIQRNGRGPDADRTRAWPFLPGIRSTPGRPRVDPGSTPGGVDHGSTTGRPRVNHGSTPGRPRGRAEQWGVKRQHLVCVCGVGGIPRWRSHRIVRGRRAAQMGGGGGGGGGGWMRARAPGPIVDRPGIVQRMGPEQGSAAAAKGGALNSAVEMMASTDRHHAHRPSHQKRIWVGAHHFYVCAKCAQGFCAEYSGGIKSLGLID
eukprot:gene24277-biopygen10425